MKINNNETDNMLGGVNLFDVIILVIVGLLVIIVATGFLKPPKIYNQDVYLKLRIIENAPDILNEAKFRVGQKVYFNGTSAPVTLVGVGEANGSDYLIIKGKGSIEDARYILNGESVAAGQKAEVHSDFQAKTVITDVQNEPFKGN